MQVAKGWMRAFRGCCAAATMAVGLAACGGSDDFQAPAVAPTAFGPVRAVEQNGMMAYRAIPYAAPPLGALRWKAPVDPTPWTDPLAKTASANTCPQNSASPFVIPSTNEDCLYLDVMAPKSGNGPFPVMVWIHGGAFLTGGAVTYADASPLVARGVIVVTINYRLGALGFLAHPALSAEQGGSSGNYGIMDQQAALRWVQQNIANFGGDRNNVTIFGESAGGFSVMSHLASPLSKGLFHKAIVQSGAYAINGQQALATSETSGSTVINNAVTAASASATCPAPMTVACLRSLPVAALMTEYGKLNSSPVPNVDGRVLPKSVKATFVAGENNKVPLVNGSNRDEYALFIAIGEAGRRAAATPPNVDPANTSFALSAAAYPGTAGALAAAGGVSAANAVAAYPLANYGSNTALQPSLAASALGTDVIFACPGLRVSQRALAQATPIWMYEFRDRTAPPFVGATATGGYTLSFSQGAAHSYELQYLFNLKALANDEQRALAAAMGNYWTNFAKSSDPNGAAAPAVAWPAFTGSDKVLGLDVPSAGGIKVLSTFDTDHRCSTTWSGITF
jgi:para-nitrobenzyl esterase